MKKIRLTITGIIYMIFSILLTAFGIFNGELLTTICGSGLFIYFLQTFIFMLLTSAIWKKTTCKTEFVNNKVFITPYRNTKKLTKFPYLFPGISALYGFNFFIDKITHRHLNIEIQLKKRGITEELFSDNERGVFTLQKEYIFISDIAGFFYIKFFKEEKTTANLTFLPQITEVENFKIPNFFMPLSGNKINMRRTDEVYETRPYVPGDDIRKINWKLYAHTDELSVNQGDFMPPPQKLFTIYIKEPILKKHSLFKETMFDEFINRAASVAIYLYTLGLSFNFLFYDFEKNEFIYKTVLNDDENGIEKIKNYFAVPQIKILKNAINKKSEINLKLNDFILQENLEEKNPFLYFIMPDGHNIKEKKFFEYLSGKDNIIFYLGPIVEINDNKNMLYNFLFNTRKIKKINKQKKILNNKVSTQKNEIITRGFYGCEI